MKFDEETMTMEELKRYLLEEQGDVEYFYEEKQNIHIELQKRESLWFMTFFFLVGFSLFAIGLSYLSIGQDAIWGLIVTLTGLVVIGICLIPLTDLASYNWRNLP